MTPAEVRKGRRWVAELRVVLDDLGLLATQYEAPEAQAGIREAFYRLRTYREATVLELQCAADLCRAAGLPPGRRMLGQTLVAIDRAAARLLEELGS